MTKTDFAELKDKLCRKIYVDIYVQREHDSAIISELIEIIQSQSEALERYSCSYQQVILTGCELAKQSLSETTTRLQKLREGIDNGK